LESLSQVNLRYFKMETENRGGKYIGHIE